MFTHLTLHVIQVAPHVPAIVLKNEYNDFKSEGRLDRSTHYEIFHYNGFIRIKSVEYGQFLSRKSYKYQPNWILGDSNDINNRDTLFKVIKLGKNAIALRAMIKYVVGGVTEMTS